MKQSRAWLGASAVAVGSSLGLAWWLTRPVPELRCIVEWESSGAPVDGDATLFWRCTHPEPEEHEQRIHLQNGTATVAIPFASPPAFHRAELRLGRLEVRGGPAIGTDWLSASELPRMTFTIRRGDPGSHAELAAELTRLRGLADDLRGGRTRSLSPAERDLVLQFGRRFHLESAIDTSADELVAAVLVAGQVNPQTRVRIDNGIVREALERSSESRRLDVARALVHLANADWQTNVGMGDFVRNRDPGLAGPFADVMTEWGVRANNSTLDYGGLLQDADSAWQRFQRNAARPSLRAHILQWARHRGIEWGADAVRVLVELYVEGLDRRQVAPPITVDNRTVEGRVHGLQFELARTLAEHAATLPESARAALATDLQLAQHIGPLTSIATVRPFLPQDIDLSDLATRYWQSDDQRARRAIEALALSGVPKIVATLAPGLREL